MSHKMSTMEKSTWEETIHTLKSSGGICLPHPRDVSEWGDDMKQWPQITYGDIFNYFVLSLGVDGSAMRNFKSTEAYQYLHSGKVGRVLVHLEEEYVFLKASVSPSQASTSSHLAWVLATSNGAVETTGCTCIAGLGRSCSHAAAILWKSTVTATEMLSNCEYVVKSLNDTKE